MARNFIQGGIQRPGPVWGPSQTDSALNSSRAINAVGSNVKRLGGGLTLFTPKSRLGGRPPGAQLFPLETVFAVTGVDNITVTGIMVVFGTIGGETPTLNGIDLIAPLISAPFQEVTSADTVVYFEADFEAGGTMSDQPQIYVGTSVPDDDIEADGSGSGYREIAQLNWDSGKLIGISPAILYSLGFNICGTSVQFFAGV